MEKKISLSLLSVFLIWQSYQLLAQVNEFEFASSLLLLFIAWLINMFITGIFAFAGFAFPTQQLLPAAYYKIHHPQRLKNVYKYLQVEVFRTVLLATLWRNQEQRTKYFNGKISGLATLEEQSMKSEFGHLCPFVIINMVGLYLVMIGLLKLGLFTLLFNFIGNFYPILLQRHHRMRIEVIRKRQQWKLGKSKH